MKKTATVLACLLLSAHGFAKDDYSRQISECVAALGNAVPDGYTHMDRTRYRKVGGDIILTIGEDKKVMESSFGYAFDRTDEAAEWNAPFYDFFEKENWQYSRHKGDIYEKGDVYAVILKPHKRDDGLIVAMITFTRDSSYKRFLRSLAAKIKRSELFWGFSAFNRAQ